jgi:hypothetical protein
VDDAWKRSFKFDSLSALFELTAGAANSEDALRRGAEKLSSIADAEFAARMNADAGFRSAVLRVAEDACAVNPFLGQRNPGCSKMQDMTERQVVLEEEERKLPQGATARESEHAIHRVRREWLDHLKERVP